MDENLNAMSEHLIKIVFSLAGVAMALVSVIYYAIMKKLNKNADLLHTIDKSLTDLKVENASIEASFTQQIAQHRTELNDHESRIRNIENNK